MEFKKVDRKYVGLATKLAKKEFRMEQEKCKILKQGNHEQILSNLIDDLFSGDYGLVAIEQGEMVGYLSFYGGINQHFGNAKGAFSPLFGSAFQGEERSKTASRLFEKLSEIMIADGISSFAISKYAHDIEIARTLVLNGFGIRCGDGVKKIDKEDFSDSNTVFQYYEIERENFAELLDLKNALQIHLCKSPIYFPYSTLVERSFLDLCERRKSRFFAARDKEKIIGYIEIDNSGETFVTDSKNMQNICGMFLDMGYRGQGIAKNLLNYVADILKKEGYSCITVDFETINPSALHFWQKHFDIYAYSYARRIDERIFEEHL